MNDTLATIGKIIGFPFFLVLAYFLYATLVGLFFSLIAWDIHILINLWQFWKPMDGVDIGRIFCWIMSFIGVSLLYSEGI
jgi:hypothetical protein